MKLRPFELTLVVIFGLLMIAALIMLKFYKPAPSDAGPSLGGPVVIWGILPAQAVNELILKLAAKDENYNKVTYKYVPPEEFDNKFVNALADGTSPDIILVSHESLVKHRTRLEPFSYDSFPVRDYRSLYVDGAEIFALSDGIYGFPIAVNPLMLYWNRDLFARQNMIEAPATWETVVSDTVPKLTTRDFNRSITKSGLAMGGYGNIRNAFPVISLLLLQGGSNMVTEEKKKYTVRLDSSSASSRVTPFQTAIAFYTNFNNVSNTLYSWNSSLAEDRELFLREELAMYFGFGSEGRELEAKNPNLNFDIAPVPQGASVSVKRTYGKYYAFMIPRLAKNKTGAYQVSLTLASQANAKIIADGSNLAPVHRASLVAGSNDLYGRVYYDSVAVARGWLNPDLLGTGSIFIKLLEDINANRSDVYSAVGDASSRLEKIY